MKNVELRIFFLRILHSSLFIPLFFVSFGFAEAVLHSTPLAFKVPLALRRGVRGEARAGGEAFLRLFISLHSAYSASLVV